MRRLADANGLMLRLAAGALALGVVAAGATLVRALKLESLPAAAAPVELLSPSGVGNTAPGVSLRPVWHDDPFVPSRTAPSTPYRLARIPASASTSPSTAQAGSKVPHLLGTVVSVGGGSFVTYDAGGGQLQHRRLGESIGEYVVDSITRGRVVLRDASGRRIDVRTTQD